MPGQLRKNLPFLSDEEVSTLFGSIITVGTYPEGSPERTGAILAYDEVMKRMLIAAVVVGALRSPLVSFTSSRTDTCRNCRTSFDY